VTLSLENPWYVFVYEVQHGAALIQQTSLVAWESALIGLLKAVPAENWRGICRMEKRVSPEVGWEPRWVSRVWDPTPPEAEHAGGLILQFEGENRQRNMFMDPVRADRGRTLLFEARAARSE
jgi:hypothetical protein